MSQESDALVIDIRGEDALLRLTKPVSGCGRCDEPGGCSTGLTARNCRTYRLPNDVGAKIGDRVSISVADGAILRAALVSYLSPAVLAILGAAAGASQRGDAWAVGGAAAGLLAGILLLRVFGRRTRGQYMPRILRVQSRATTGL
ncbi:MAG: SoxR reducing system RseC family protein [Rhodocyclaceae bacterium]|nr:SoxR reducing system RseC family protein [Rhodocyclaceae bacterium]